MRNGVSTLLYFMFQVDHEQSSTLGYDIIMVAFMLELIVEFGRGHAVNDIYDNLQSIGKHVRRLWILQELFKYPSEHLLGFVVFAMFDIYTCLLQVSELLRERSEVIHLDQ